MGLDNGILIRAKSDLAKDFLAIHFSKDDYDKYEDAYEIAYWRKCHNIRDAFIEDAYIEDNSPDGGYHYNRKMQNIVYRMEDIPNILDVLKPFLDEEYWNRHSESMWEWYQIVPGIAEAISILTRLYKNYCDIVKETGKLSEDDFCLEFYDSY